MSLRQKKQLAGKALGVGANKIQLNPARESEIQEAITRQDMKDLFADGALSIRENSGRQKVVKRKTRKMSGNVRKTVNNRKELYVKLTRKLRGYLKELKVQGKIDNTKYRDVRKKIKSREYKSKSHLKELLGVN